MRTSPVAAAHPAAYVVAALASARDTTAGVTIFVAAARSATHVAATLAAAHVATTRAAIGVNLAMQQQPNRCM